MQQLNTVEELEQTVHKMMVGCTTTLEVKTFSLPTLLP